MRQIMPSLVSAILLALSASLVGMILQNAAMAESTSLEFENPHGGVSVSQVLRVTRTPLPKIPRLGSEDTQTNGASENAPQATQTEVYKWTRNLTAKNPSFNLPFGVAVAQNNKVYVVDGNNKLVRVFDGSAKYKKSFGAGQFVGPYGIAVDAGNNIYVTDYDANLVRKFNKKFKLVKSWGGYGSDDGKFDSPAGIWVDGTRVFVTDVGNNRVQVFDTNGSFMTKFGGYGATKGKFYSPYGVVVDKLGYAYVADTGNNRIQKCSPHTNTYLCDQVMPGQFKSPLLMTTDKDKTRIYVADSKNNQIQAFDTDWKIIAKFGANGNTKKRMRNPVGVAVTGQYQVVVTDTLNNRAQHWCGYCPWKVVSAPSEGALNAAAVISADDIWAVGLTVNGETPTTLHWDGSAWSSVSGPTGGYLNGIAAFSANDVWAIGAKGGVESWVYTVTRHWDGKSWTDISSPNAPCSGFGCWIGYPNHLNDIGGVSSNDVWAVGDGRGDTLILHWNGTNWSIIPSPYYPAGESSLEGVAVVSANDVWAVGNFGSNGNTRNFIMHWDGTSWSSVLSPTISTGNNSLYDVAVVSSNNVWAVGSYYENGVSRNLIQHWDGFSWEVVPNPNFGTGNNSLASVQASSANDIWAAGEMDGKALLMHWDGSTWSRVATPDTGTSRFEGLGIVSGKDVWAVGSGPNGTLIERGGLPCPRKIQ